MKKTKIEKRKVVNLSLEIQKINKKQTELLEDIYAMNPSEDLLKTISSRKLLEKVGLNYYKLLALNQFVSHPQFSYRDHLNLLIRDYNLISRSTTFEGYLNQDKKNKQNYRNSLPPSILKYQEKYLKDLFLVHSVGSQKIVDTYLNGDIDFLRDVSDLRSILKLVYPDQVEQPPADNI